MHQRLYTLVRRRLLTSPSCSTAMVYRDTPTRAVHHDRCVLTLIHPVYRRPLTSPSCSTAVVYRDTPTRAAKHVDSASVLATPTGSGEPNVMLK